MLIVATTLRIRNRNPQLYTRQGSDTPPQDVSLPFFIRVLSRNFFLSSAAYPIKYFLYSLYEYNKNHQEKRTDVLFIIKLYLSANRQFYKIILRLSLTAQDSAVA